MVLNTGPVNASQGNDQMLNNSIIAKRAAELAIENWHESRAAEERTTKELIKQCGGLIEFVRGKYSVPVGTALSCPYMRAIEECLHKLQS